MRSIFIIIIISFLLTACGTAAPTHGITATIPPTSPLAPTATPTDEATATPEIKQFNVCTPENFRDCPISFEDLTDGTYLNWLRTLSKPFDPSEIETDVPLVWYKVNGVYEKIAYNLDTDPNFTGKNEGKEPLRMDVTAGYLNYTTPDGKNYEYIVMPIEFYDQNNPTVSQWVITVQSYPNWWYQYTKEDQQAAIKTWKKGGADYLRIFTRPEDQYANLEDPLTAMTFEKYPDMADRFMKFVNGNNFKPGGDLSTLSQPGIILNNRIFY